MKLLSILAIAATAILPTTVSAQGGTTGGGWYVVNESLSCTRVCDQVSKCNIMAGPSASDIAAMCKKVTDDCADGTYSGHKSHGYGTPYNGVMGTNRFPTNAGNLACPNQNQCNLSFQYLIANMRYPSAPGRPNAYCAGAQIDVKSYRTHQNMGTIFVGLPTIQRAI